jgi:hypothetical protein
MNQSTKESHRIAHVRADAIMSAVVNFRNELATETEIGRVGSAYMTIRSLVYDLIDGAYWEGYSTGEDEANMRAVRSEGESE